MNELELKSTGRKCEVKLNGEDLRHVTEITIHVVGGEYPVVTIVQDSDFRIKGFLVSDPPAKLYCPKCSHIIGEVTGCYDVRCPVCDTDIVKE